MQRQVRRWLSVHVLPSHVTISLLLLAKRAVSYYLLGRKKVQHQQLAMETGKNVRCHGYLWIMLD